MYVNIDNLSPSYRSQSQSKVWVGYLIFPKEESYVVFEVLNTLDALECVGLCF